MKKLMAILPIFFFTAGCMAFYQPAPNRIDGLYYQQIKDWQNRIQKEGWVETLVDEVVDQCLKFSKFRQDQGDHWDTPKEFMKRGFQGDCEDIAIFMMATLRRLEYPHHVRVLAVETLVGDHHAVLKVEMPDTKWKIFETLPMPLNEIDRLFYKPIVEFDDNHIIYYASKNS